MIRVPQAPNLAGADCTLAANNIAGRPHDQDQNYALRPQRHAMLIIGHCLRTLLDDHTRQIAR